MKLWQSADPVGSLRGQFLRWLLIPLLLLVALNAYSVYRNALDAADLAYDRSLLASARALSERVSIVDGKLVANVPYVALDSFETDTLGRLYYKVTGVNGEFVSGYEDLPTLPSNVPRSEIYPALVHFFRADYLGQEVRIAALHQPVYDDRMRGIALIEVGETMDARRGLSRTILIDTLLRQAALVLAVALMVWVAVRFVLHPLMQLKSNVETREPTDLSDFDPALVHKEIRPLIIAMNGYMARLQDADQRAETFHRRRFAPVAHPADGIEDPGRTGAARKRYRGDAADSAKHCRHYRLYRASGQPAADAGPHRPRRRRRRDGQAVLARYRAPGMHRTGAAGS